MELDRTARQRENRITVEWGMCRAHRACNPILRHHGHALAFRGGQIGVAGDHAHTGVPGNQKVMYTPAATASPPTAITCAIQ